MAGKGRNAVRIETEIEKSREDSNWKRVIELADQLKSRNAAQAPLCSFLLGEGKLEMFLEDWPPVDFNFNRARSGLAEAKRCLLTAASDQGKKAGVALDAHLLLGKLHYAMGFFEESLNHYNEADLQSLTEKALPSRSLRIVAESYAIKGLCLEKVPPSSTSKYKQVEWEEQMGRCFELAGDLTLLYLQEQDKMQQQIVTTGTFNTTGTGGSHSPQPQDSTRNMGPILETAIQRAPLLYIQTGKIPQAVTRYRNMLCAVESSGTHGLRLTLARQLAEVLLRGYTGTRYTPPSTSLYMHRSDIELPSALLTLTCNTLNVIASKKSSAVSAWKPRLYTGINLFIPRNEYEEVILLLLISEAMAVREAVLSQSPEFKEVRIRAFSNAMVIYDLLTIALVRWGQVSLLYECLDRAMKFSYEEAHIWLQQALCLESMGHHIHALAVLKEVVRLLPSKVMPCLIAARICYQHLNQISEGMQWSLKALARQTSHPQNLLSRCHLYVGIGAHYGAIISHLNQEKLKLYSLAAESFLKSQQNDPNDHLVEYYLGLQCASRAQVSEAVSHTKAALKLCPEHAPSIHLMVLLLTAQKQLTEAHTLLETALQDFPDNLNFLYIKTHLQLQTHGPEVALATAKQMLSLWKVLYEEQVQQVQSEQPDNRSFFQLYTSEMSDKDSSSLHAHSLAASRVEQALSEVASSISSFTPRPGPQRAWLLQLQVWLLVAEIYLALDQVSAAAASIQEATSIFPLSHHIMYTRGLVHEHKHEFMEAKQCYQNAVAINPSHIKSLQHLGLMYHYLGSHRLAEKTLRDAAKIDPHAPTTWYNLGKVLEALGDCQRASDCMATALQVDAVSPLLPYSSIPITFE